MPKGSVRPGRGSKKLAFSVGKEGFGSVKHKSKHEVLGRKRQATSAAASKSRRKALKKRRTMLLQDLKQLNTSNKFADQRVTAKVGTDGQSGPGSAQPDDGFTADSRPEDMIAHKRRPTAKQRKAKHSVFLLQAMDEDQVFDERLGAGENGATSNTSGQQAESSDDELFERADSATATADPSATGEEKSRSHRDIMKEVMMKSKLHKFEKQRGRVALAEDRAALDDQFKSIYSDIEYKLPNEGRMGYTAARMLAQARAEKAGYKLDLPEKPESMPVLTEHDETMARQVDQFLAKSRQLDMETRVRATDRLRTQEEVAMENQRRLRELEQERVRRMTVGDDEEGLESGVDESETKDAVTAADEDVVDVTGGFEDDVGGNLLLDPQFMAGGDVSDGDYDDVSSSEDEKKAPAATTKTKLTDMSVQENAEMVSASTVPFILSLPDSVASLRRLIATYQGKQVAQDYTPDADFDMEKCISDVEAIVLDRIFVQYHPHTSQDNRRKLATFLPVVLSYFGQLCTAHEQLHSTVAIRSLKKGGSQKADRLLSRLLDPHSRFACPCASEARWTKLGVKGKDQPRRGVMLRRSLDTVTQLVYAMSRHYMKQVGALCRERLRTLATQTFTCVDHVMAAYEKATATVALQKVGDSVGESKSMHALSLLPAMYPSATALFFAKLCSQLFPASDARHHVLTPLTLYLSRCLARIPVYGPRDAQAGLFTCSLLLQLAAVAQTGAIAARGHLQARLSAAQKGSARMAGSSQNIQQRLLAIALGGKYIPELFAFQRDLLVAAFGLHTLSDTPAGGVQDLLAVVDAPIATDLQRFVKHTLAACRARRVVTDRTFPPAHPFRASEATFVGFWQDLWKLVPTRAQIAQYKRPRKSKKQTLPYIQVLRAAHGQWANTVDLSVLSQTAPDPLPLDWLFYRCNGLPCLHSLRFKLSTVALFLQQMNAVVGLYVPSARTTATAESDDLWTRFYNKNSELKLPCASELLFPIYQCLLLVYLQWFGGLDDAVLSADGEHSALLSPLMRSIERAWRGLLVRLSDGLARVTELRRPERRHTALHQIKSYNPFVHKKGRLGPHSDPDPDRERAELRKLRRQHKREITGVMKELRKDALFLQQERQRKYTQVEKDRALLVRRGLALLQDEAREANLFTGKTKMSTDSGPNPSRRTARTYKDGSSNKR